MKKMLLKLQRPVRAGDPDKCWMFQNIDKTFRAFVADKHISDSLRRMMGDKFKIYVIAEQRTRSTIRVLGVAPDQWW